MPTPTRIACAPSPSRRPSRSGRELALAKTVREPHNLTEAFERFFREAARTAYPAGGFADVTKFHYGAELNLRGG
jgi:hypothetical protein